MRNGIGCSMAEVKNGRLLALQNRCIDRQLAAFRPGQIAPMERGAARTGYVSGTYCGLPLPNK
jgi:hypothetical protein